MSRVLNGIAPDPVENAPGLQYPSDINLDPSNPTGFALKNAYDNLFYLRRKVEGLKTQDKSLTAKQIQALITIAVNRARIQTASAIVGTHAVRVSTYAAASGAIGAEFFETDRTSYYIISDSTGTKKWTFSSGSMSAALASRPTDLGTADAGFLFTDTTSDTETQYIWDGVEWLTIGGYLQSVTDATNNAITTVQVLEHLVAGAGANGMGLSQLVRLRDDASATVNASASNTVATVAAAATFTTSWSKQLRSAGAALADYFSVLVSGIRFKVGGFWAILIHANTADRTYTYPDATGSLVYQTAALPNNNLLLGGGGALVKDQGGTVWPIANGGTNANTAAGARASLSAAQIQTPGGPHTVPLAKITGGGVDGSITFNAEGVITAFVDPT